ncbi:MAG: sensor histidine kinase [Lachnospiraceae bacterium]|nr:sensor histidine kinase [Lachnospiraceae bacterium]
MNKKNPIQKFIHNINYDMKLSRKLLLAFLTLLLFPTIAMGILLYGQISKIVIEDTLEAQLDLTGQTSATVESAIAAIGEIANIIQSDSYISDITFHPEIMYKHTPEELRSQANAFLQNVESHKDNGFVKNIKIYMEPTFKPLYTDNSSAETFQSFDKIKSSYWYGIMKSSSNVSLQCPTFYLTQQEAANYGDTAYVRRIIFRNAYRNDTAAYLVLYFDSGALCEAMTHDSDPVGSVNFLVNSRENIIASSDYMLSAMYFDVINSLATDIINPNTFVSKNILGKELFVCYNPISGTDWNMISVIPAGPLRNKAFLILAQYTAVFTISIILAIMLALALSRSMSKRITKVVNMMDTGNADKVSKISGENGKDEIGEFITSYNSMADRVNDLILKQHEAAEKLKTSEFNALQAQINPHFLYNTLDMINWMALEGRSEEASEAVRNLSKFYRLTLSKHNTIDTVEKELQHVSIYVKLQNMRFNDKIDFLADVPDNILKYQIPKLTFQPIVENAILHGILEKPEKSGTIVLTAWLEGNDIHFLISDDGVGMDEDTLSSILSTDERPERTSSSGGNNIAINNTHQRLKLLYGEQYGLSYSSVKGSGTEVTVVIPAIE